MVQSLAAGHPVAPERISTDADGLTAPRPGEITFELIRRHAAGILTVTDDQILAAMGHLIRNLKVIVEPSAAVPFAALLADERFRGKRVGILLSGGNAATERVRNVI